SLNALTLGEETAQSLGVSLGRTSLRLVLGTALCVGASVSICGSIGFLGLVVPHLCRPFTGHEPGRVLVPSALAGALLLLLADIAVRVIPSGTELKLGVVTSLVGVPFFLALIFKTRRELS
ncbi:MAG TPA: iron chelate uptake ABC transporter family permease subunit, partial [Verrucomicrobiae bacterium]|nr:iron chelate uptake ABC transporter family permease subunit [Verrucomicrobiae bacterium]